MMHIDKHSSQTDNAVLAPFFSRVLNNLRHSTIRVRLTLWYVLLLGVILIVFSGALYVILDNSLDGQVDANLRVSGEQALGALIVETGQLRVQQNEGESEISPLGERGLLVRVLGPDGNSLASAGPYRAMPLTESILAAAKTGQSGFSDAAVPGAGTPVRLYTASYAANGRTYGAVVVGQSLQPNQDALHQLLVILAGAVPLTLVLASVGGMFLSDRALRPIDRITTATQRISAEDLSRRLNLDLPQDEVGRLARTFDSMLARLDEAFQRQKRFTADASHELRTPLAIMKGDIGVALNRPRRAAEYKAVLNDIEEEVDRLTRLVNDLLLLARADASRPIMRSEPLDLTDLLGVLVEQMRSAAQAKELTLTLDAPVPVCTHGDVDKLTRLFLNLLDNAIKYTPTCGRITVRILHETENEVAVKVADNGPGIPAEELEHIFDRFYRVDAARSRAVGGTGLGLTIARWIAEAHGGRLEVESSQGQGSTFSAWLPNCVE